MWTNCTRPVLSLTIPIRVTLLICRTRTSGYWNKSRRGWLTHLVLAETKITDNSLDSIKGLALLELLDLSETPITDAVATVLYRLPCVRILGLYATRITDLAMESISKLPRLESLNISLNPQITDSGFSCLANSRQLKSVEIHGTEISDAAVKEFSIQYPNVLIVTDAGPVRGIA